MGLPTRPFRKPRVGDRFTNKWGSIKRDGLRTIEIIRVFEPGQYVEAVTLSRVATEGSCPCAKCRAKRKIPQRSERLTRRISFKQIHFKWKPLT